MGKISKYSNLYDKDNNFLHKPGNYSIEELEELVDTLDKNSKEFSNATAILMHMYEQKDNRDRFIQKFIKQPKTKTTKAEVINALNNLKDEEIGKDDSVTEGCVSDITEGDGESRGGSRANETDTTISSAA